MGIKDLLLSPFKTHLKLPKVNLPVSTISIPPTPICILIVMISFFFITGGFIFCAVRGAPFIGGVYGRDGKVVASWYSPGSSSQFGAEGCLIGGIFTLGAFSLLSAMIGLDKNIKSPLNEENMEAKEQPKKNSKKNAKKETEEDNSMATLAGYFGMTAVFWCFLTYSFFRMKIPSFHVAFTARY